MIKIVETKPPRKVSGITSFLITFPYNDTIISVLKGLPTVVYHKKDFTWEIPLECLAQALDSLTFIDDIELIMLPEDSPDPKQIDFKLTDSEIAGFKATPFPHQIEGVNYGLNPEKPKWILGDSMGTGKSIEIILYAETLKRRGLIDHAMIICGVDSLRQNWKREIEKFSNESCLVLGEKQTRTGRIYYEPIKKRAEILKNPISEFFVIINAATLRYDEIVEAYKKSANTFGLIAVDEVHKFATKTSAQGANLLKLKADYKVAASGTLLLNSPLSCYMPLSWTENDKAPLSTFKSQYCEFGGFGNHQIVGYQNLEHLQEEIQSCMIRRTLDQVRADMPEKIINYELIEMSDEHQKFYEAIKNGVKEEADKIDLKSANILALTTRLRQATACPAILTTQDIASSKIDRCCEIVEDLVSQGEKVVVLSVFKETAYQIADRLREFKPTINTGDQDDTLVFKNMEAFQNDPAEKLFIGTHGKCGTGWTLNAAKYAIFTDTPWTDAALSQSADRIWRVTNTHPAIITVLACANTIDERVREIVDTKKELADFVIDGKANSLSQELKGAMIQILKDL